MQSNSIKELSVVELEGVVAAYPWYTYARELLLCKLASIGYECFSHNLRDYAAFVQNIDRVIEKGNAIINAKMEQESFEEVIDLDILNEWEESKPKIHIIGGDYFSTQDLADLEREKRVEKVAKYVPKEGDKPLADYAVAALQMSDEDFNSPEFYTETLAQIFTEQGYYDKAIEVYAKLILLYPEKSAYFATLADNVKLKN